MFLKRKAKPYSNYKNISLLLNYTIYNNNIIVIKQGKN
jgi:hypothetical protein